MAYTPHQQQMIRLALSLTKNAPPKVRQALLAAMAVESNFRHVNYGDRDSVGILQQRPSQGWGPAGESPAKDIRDFLQRAIPASRSFQGTPGQLAQKVQVSAYPDRYDKRMNQVQEILRSFGGGAGAPTPAAPGTALPSPSRSAPQGNSSTRLRLLRENLGQGPGALVRALATAPRVPPGGSERPVQATGAPGGNIPAGGGFSPEELFYDPMGAYKLGQKIPAIGGHGGHVHVAEDNPLQMLQIIQLAKRLGLATRENPWVDPVDPVHTKKSYHYRSQPFRGRQMGRGLDVSGNAAAMRKLFLALSRGFR